MRTILVPSLAALAVVVASPAAVSSAAPGQPLIETTCSYQQLVAAMRVEAPMAADFLDNNPTAQTRLQNFLGLTVDERRQRVQQKLDENPQWRTKIEERRDTAAGQEIAQTMQRIADTCGGY